MRHALGRYASVFRLTLAAGLLAVPLLRGDDSGTTAKPPAAQSPPRTTRRRYCATWRTTAKPPAAQSPPAPAEQTTTGNAAPAAEKPPELLAVVPAVPTSGPNRPLTLQGSGLADGLAVRLTDPQGNTLAAASIRWVSSERVDIVAQLGTPGTWTVTATNPKARPMEPLKFPVAGSPPISLTSPAVVAFGVATLIVTILLIVLFSYMLHDLRTSQKSGQWSFGDALSEECEFQPKEIRQKSDVILLGSSSRLIALLGLLGILTVVIGVGYSVMWNLFLYGTVPDLSQVRTFLYGSACLFAPYLANKLAGMVPTSTSPKVDGTDPAVAITGVTPSSLRAAAGAQTLRVTGSGFKTGLTLTLTDPQNASNAVPVGDVVSVENTLAAANVLLATPGSWKVAVKNPDSATPVTYSFSVAGPPNINATDPAAGALAHGPDARQLAFIGTGFVGGLTVSLTPPAGAAFAVPATSVTSTRVQVTTTLAVDGGWHVTITNPGDGANASPAFAFNVA